MKSWSLRIIVCLLLGAITTVVVAWGLAFWMPVGSEARRFSGDGEEGSGRGPTGWEHWMVQRNEGFGCTRFESRYLVNVAGSFVMSQTPAESLVPTWARPDIVLGRDTQDLLFFASGFPYRAFRCHFEFHWVADATTLTGGMRMKSRPLETRPGSRTVSVPAIPYQPIWPGFLIDTLFYAAL